MYMHDHYQKEKKTNTSEASLIQKFKIQLLQSLKLSEHKMQQIENSTETAIRLYKRHPETLRKITLSLCV